MQKNHQITRSNVNESNVVANQFPKSGFNLTYSTNTSAVLGRLFPSTYQYIMPGDKFSGANEGTMSFNTISTPLMSDVKASQHNFYMPFRAVDTDFEELMSPSKLNNMSVDLKVPQFSLYDVVLAVSQFLPEIHPSLFVSANNTWLTAAQYDAIFRFVDNVANGTFATNISKLKLQLAKSYCDDVLDDLVDQIRVTRVTGSQWSAFNDADKVAHVKVMLQCLCDFFFGEGSLLDHLGYNILDHEQLYTIVDNWVASSKPKSFYLYNSCSKVPQCEYALRIWYAIWYEWYRDTNLEPKIRSNVYNYRKWDKTSQVVTSVDSRGIFLIVTRARSWDKDMFTTAEIDDMSRHVFAPVMSANDGPDAFGHNFINTNDFLKAESADGLNMAQRGLYDVSLRYLDENGVTKTIVCPIPAGNADSISEVLHSTNKQATEGYQLDLMNLRNSKMLESYLKRNFYFGDEYRDRMLAHYGVRVSDMRVNRPEYLGGSLDSSQMEQKINATETSEMAAGERTAVGGVSIGKDGFEFFAEEFGLYIGALSFMPTAQYDPLCAQHLITRQTDFPLPEFAQQQDECGRLLELSRSGYNVDAFSSQFGHYPYAHAWRSRVDEIHGDFLSTRRDYTFARYWNGAGTSIPALNYKWLHCRPSVPMFVNKVLLDGQLYGTIKHNFFVERCLPTPVEVI